MALGRDEILGCNDLPVDEFPVPEWNGDVLLKMLNGQQREVIETRSHKARTTGDAIGWKGLKALVCAYAIVGDDGKHLFTEKDVNALNEKSTAAIERIFDHVMKVNGLTKKDAEELAGN